MKIVIGIPARMGSSRFPGKPLALLDGRPMLAHVIARAQEAELGPVVVATDDRRIAALAESCGVQACMTPASCASGTERLASAFRAIEADIVVNVQGDEPLIDPMAIRAVVRPLIDDASLPMATLAHPLSEEECNNPHAVKVVCDARGRALYFSRAPIPYARDRGCSAGMLKHIGLYAYRRSFLLQYPALPSCPLEQAEQLEQLRVLFHGYPIAVTVGDYASVGVDTPEDLERVERLLRGRRGE